MKIPRGLIRASWSLAWSAACAAAGATVLVCAAEQVARAGVEAWRVNEIASSNAGDPALRFVELYAPPSPSADNCFFPSTRLEILADDGTVIGTVTPFVSTTCYAGDTYFLFAPAAAGAFYGVPRDAALPYAIPAAGGQVCLRSSSTRYDCARWGAVTMPVVDFGDPSDTTSAPALTDGAALARVATTDVVATDFVLQMPPTPRQPNDGTVWLPPDAGPIPDAGMTPDAAPPADARQFFDAPPDLRPDARDEPAGWLNADPGGGGCGVGRHATSRPSFPALLVAGILLTQAAGYTRKRLRRRGPKR